MTAAPSGTRTRIPEWTFADRLRKVRTDVLGLHQAQIAEQLGVTKAAYAAWESGRTQPRNILALANQVENLSDVPAAWLLGVDGPPASGALSERDDREPDESVTPCADNVVHGRFPPRFGDTAVPRRAA